ncbi:hypothetical protein JMN32_00050 [Fulvivirga sp. 29W222]|uniref:Uncharacterized protein n=1 Tax=Fulvivirga marina TaxID=2494733 RepID=A0A937KBZ4_9BACT|nr:hypothetical protein [Fulvivirga marina]MBL6444678.1 hypothetical protein [Fulvivirga marina]
MIIPIPSNNKRFTIRLGIAVHSPVVLGIRAYDPTTPNTHYLRRMVAFNKENKAYREIDIPMPLSPKAMEVELYNKRTGDDTGFRVTDFDVHKMLPIQVWAQPEVHRFIDFAQKFSQKAGYTPTGFHHNKDSEFLIQYLPEILDDSGKRLVTPARTHRATGRIQVSQKLFRQFTVPIRFFILLHERQHFVIPTREEKPADLAALQIYLDMGFPRIEAVYAATKVFGLHPETVGQAHVTRTRDIMDFINQHAKKIEAHEQKP